MNYALLQSICEKFKFWNGISKTAQLKFGNETDW